MMPRTLLLLLLACPLASVAADTAKTPRPQVVLETSLGAIVIELLDDRAPLSSRNFLDYVQAHFYDGTIFHRVIAGFMVQGGGFTADMHEKAARAPVKNEAANGIRNARGTVALARTADPDSATSQFFINLAENNFLDHQDSSPRGIGYAVFGRVVKGMEVVDAIAAVPTANAGMLTDVPTTPVTLKSVHLAAPTP